MTSLHKIQSAQKAAQRIASWRVTGQRVVFTNGCFDLLHPGHVTYLEAARGLGARLVVGLNDDDSVRRLKGPTRPVLTVADRATILAGLEAVDLVVPFAEDTPLELILQLRPDVLAKGGDYDPSTMVGAKEVAGWGGEVTVIPFVAGKSTTQIVEKILAEGRGK